MKEDKKRPYTTLDSEYGCLYSGVTTHRPECDCDLEGDEYECPECGQELDWKRGEN